ncbi:MAG: 2-oxoacid:ferredoxin oxidoreductase subunit beta [Xanthomonadales bacterium]|nr:2-oxoacid:ferredoxin oxidoreductase subunit beta [Xanthomonadales bacterium]MDH4020403.1 2-oxoacid:ferredoxin oxidoreductase subunit beta [Xanthomonadales bacterium]
MSFIKKPKIDLPGQLHNEIGLLKRDYEGALSTLCAGCGHDSITAAIVQAFWELSIPPEQVIKLSGIGCSSKTPAYFLSGAHGFNSVHGRMPSVAIGAHSGNRDLVCIGVSGDGDSLSIGFGQFGHAVRRNLNMLYIIENNGVYGLTKGQFSAAADKGSKSKRGDINQWKNIDAVSTAISMGSSFVARSFSGDREQLVTLIKAGIMHPGCAILDVVSPCVTFNNHAGSTKSYTYTRDHYHPASQTDFITPASEIKVSYAEGTSTVVELHDGSKLLLKKASSGYDATDRSRVMRYLEQQRAQGEVVTGLLYINAELPEMHRIYRTSEIPMKDLEFEKLNPGSEALAKLQARMR